MNIPSILFENDRSIFKIDRSIPGKEESFYTKTLRDALYNKDFSMPKRRNVYRDVYSSPVCQDFFKATNDFSILNDAYSNPIATSNFHDTVSFGLVGRVSLIKRNPLTNEVKTTEIYMDHDVGRYSILSVTRWSKNEKCHLAAIQNNFAGLRGPREVRTSTVIKIFDIVATVFQTDKCMHPTKARVLEWKDAHSLFVGDVYGDLTTYDFRMKIKAEHVRNEREVQDMTSLSVCENLIAMGFNSNHLVIFDKRKLDKPLFSYQFRAAVLGLKFLRPYLLIAGAGTGDQSVKFFDPTVSGDFQPYFSLEGLGQVNTIEILKNQLLVGSGFSSSKALRFYRLRGRHAYPELIGCHDKSKMSDRVSQISRDQKGSKAFFLTVNNDKAKIDEITLPSIQRKGSNNKRFTLTEIR